jgi:hypothetical protein
MLDRFDEGERAVIARLLERRFNLAEDAARIELIEMLSEVTYADGALDWCEHGTARQRVIGLCRLDRTIRFPAPAPGVEIQEKKTLP